VEECRVIVYTPPDWACKTSWSDAHFLLADDTKEIAADRPPGLGDHPPAWNLRRRFPFQLRIDNIWFCKLLLLFTIETKTDAGMKKHACAFVYVLEEYNDHRRPGLHILPFMHNNTLHIMA
jgi:hypothetical protein